MTRDRGPRPLAALDSHVAFLRALGNPALGNKLVSAMTGGKVVGGDWVRAVADGLNRAATIVVTEHMLDEVLRRMDGIPFGDPLEHRDLTFPGGYVVFPRPVVVPDLEPDDYVEVYPPRDFIAFDAGFWIPSGVSTTPGYEADHSGVLYAQSVSPGLADQWLLDSERIGGIAGLSAKDKSILQRGQAEIHSMKLPHLPIYATGFGYGMSWDPELRDEDFVLTPAGEFERRFWLSLWRTLGEEIIAPVSVPRGDRRRAERYRGKALPPEVVVADLRRIKRRMKVEPLVDGSAIMWSHRWRVRGHQRTLNRGTDAERTVWVREHVKGPENRPLIDKDTVWRLKR